MNIQAMPIPSLTVGGRVFTDLDNLIILSGGKLLTNTRWTYRKAGESTGFQVPAGKIFRIMAVNATGSTSGLGMAIAQSDNDAGMNTTTALTNPIYEDSIGGITIESGNARGDIREISLNFPILAEKFISASSYATSGSLICRIYGYLEDAP